MPFSYEEAAKRGEPMPDGLSWAEQVHYQAIAALTARYLAHGINAEQAVKEKREIDIKANDAMRMEKYLNHTVNLYIDVEWEAINLRKILNQIPQEKRTEAENTAQKLLDVIYGFFRYSKQEQEQHRKELEEGRSQ